jgi:HSP20 family protein
MTLIRRSDYLPTWANLVNDFFNTDFSDWSLSHYSDTNTTLPAVNIKENTDGFMVEMAAPGMAKDDFKIELNNDLLTISSEKKNEHETKEGETYTRREYSYQSFSRSFTLPKSVDAEKISAKYENGILSIEIPKKEEAKPKPAKQISIA